MLALTRDFALLNSSDTSEDEMDDQDINQILIVTQKPRRILSKHPQGDRPSGSHQSRNKMTADLAQTINDGLYYYEQVRKCSSKCITLYCSTGFVIST